MPLARLLLPVFFGAAMFVESAAADDPNKLMGRRLLSLEYVIIRSEPVREMPAADSDQERPLPLGMVYVDSIVYYARSNPWALVVRDGERIGYLPRDALARLQ
jgi:hypothetical protein